MKLYLDELSEGVNRFSFSNTAAELDLENAEITCLSLVSTQIQVIKDSDTVFVTGVVSARVRMECARCLEPFERDLQQDFDLIFRKRKVVERGKGEIELSKEDLVTFGYEGDIIDLHDRIRETLLLAIPMKPLCSEDCKGLCPICGQNLNEGECNCQRRAFSPDFSELLNLNLERS